ncbi:uncharacterized protein LOC143301766 [Babylonia areolata]|uniref:uncharacterized protein LOC143301766 n=1 Tax=Babylonia areolata TaxID=304850 RepID=UPI003FD00484
MLATLRQRSNKCPTLSMALPRHLFCTLDEQCLGLECCLDLRVAMFRKVYKVYLRLDPCSHDIILGIQDPINKYETVFGKDFALEDIFGGADFETGTGIMIDALNAQIYLRGQINREDTQVVLTVWVVVCKTNDASVCIVEMQVLDRAVMPIPLCGPDGTIHVPKVDLSATWKNQKDKFKANAKSALADTITYAADKVFDAIPCLASDCKV